MTAYEQFVEKSSDMQNIINGQELELNALRIRLEVSGSLSRINVLSTGLRNLPPSMNDFIANVSWLTSSIKRKYIRSALTLRWARPLHLCSR